jgi:hypothetical protein
MVVSLAGTLPLHFFLFFLHQPVPPTDPSDPSSLSPYPSSSVVAVLGMNLGHLFPWETQSEVWPWKGNMICTATTGMADFFFSQDELISIFALGYVVSNVTRQNHSVRDVKGRESLAMATPPLRSPVDN